ncbi:MAG: universal stress protein [Vicinamibacterales bacterium]
MKILIAVDGSPCSQAAVRDVSMRPWPEGTEVELLTVISTRMPFIPEPTGVLLAAHETLLREARLNAPDLLAHASATLTQAQPTLVVTTKTVDGHAGKAIVDEAAAWGADLIVLGAHGYNAASRLFLGSVSQAVVQHAGCSVEVARSPRCLEGHVPAAA